MNNQLLFGMGFWVLLAVVAVWSLIWKGLALWRAARTGQTRWFVAILVLNTVGILEILYLYVFSKRISRHDENATPTIPQ